MLCKQVKAGCKLYRCTHALSRSLLPACADCAHMLDCTMLHMASNHKMPCDLPLDTKVFQSRKVLSMLPVSQVQQVWYNFTWIPAESQLMHSMPTVM